MELIIGVSFLFGHTQRKFITRSFCIFGHRLAKNIAFLNFTDCFFRRLVFSCVMTWTPKSFCAIFIFHPTNKQPGKYHLLQMLRP